MPRIKVPMIESSLSNIQFVNRVALLKSLCSGKKVLHLGATDAPETIIAARSNRLLHMQMNQVADKLVGIDIDKEMICWLADNYGINNIIYGDIEKIEYYPSEEFDIIIAGEILEHLNNPGKSLENIRNIMRSHTQLVITVPNAYSLKGFIRACLRHELIHPDHLLHHSPYTLKMLLERFDFTVEFTFSFPNGGKGLHAQVANYFIKFNPHLAEGIGVICRAT